MKVILLASLFMSLGCSTTRDYTTLTKQIGDYGLESYTDKNTGNICYVYSDKDNIAMSCVNPMKGK
jgi:hypothetical protein